MSLCISSVIRFMVSCSAYVTVFDLSLPDLRICVIVTGRMLITGCLCVTVYDTAISCVNLEPNDYVRFCLFLLLFFLQLINLSYLRLRNWPN